MITASWSGGIDVTWATETTVALCDHVHYYYDSGADGPFTCNIFFY